MTSLNDVNTYIYDVVKKTSKDTKIIQQLEVFNIQIKDSKLKGINCDPYIRVKLSKPIRYLKIEFEGNTSNRSNKLKLYYAKDCDFKEEYTYDLGEYFERKISKVINFQSNVNAIRLDLGDYDSLIDIYKLSIHPVSGLSYAFMHSLNQIQLGIKAMNIALTNKVLIKKAFAELKYNGIKVTKIKVYEKINQKNSLEVVGTDFSNECDNKIIVCIHDMFKAGAQALTCTIVDSLVDELNFSVVVFTIKGGALISRIESKAKVINLNQNFVSDIVDKKNVVEKIKILKSQGYTKAICNSCATGSLTKLFTENGIECIGLVHELPTTLLDYGLTDVAKYQAQYAQKLIFANNFVKNKFKDFTKFKEEKAIICPQAIKKPIKISRSDAREYLIKQYDLKKDSIIILGAGVGGLRKGIDAFLNIGKICLKNFNSNYVFIWAGTLDPEIKTWILHDIQVENIGDHFIILDFVDDIKFYEAGADVFLMTSREDPFPSIVMECMYHGTPVISFDKSGGVPELLVNDRGVVVDYMDIIGMSEAINKLTKDNEFYQLISQTGQAYVEENFNPKDYANQLLNFLEFKSVNKKEVPDPYHAHIRQPIEKNRRRVLHFIDNFSTGGSSKLVVDIIEWLGHKYEQVIVANYHPDRLEYDGVDVIRMTDTTPDSMILNYITEFKPDIIHIHYWESRWYTKIINLLEFVPECRIIENVNIPISPYTRPYIDKYVFVSDYTLKEYGEDMEKSLAIYPGSDFSFFNRNIKGDFLPKDTIGMVYRLDIDKLTDYSIDVFIRAIEKRPTTKAIIVGGGPRYNQYYNKVKKAGLLENFTFTGFVSYETLLSYYEKFTIFVAPVWRESFGQVTPFAMSMGIPVAGYNIGALYEITNSKELLAEFEDIEQLSDIIVDLLDDYQKCKSIGRYNADRAHELFSLESMIQAYAQLYESLTER